MEPVHERHPGRCIECGSRLPARAEYDRQQHRQRRHGRLLAGDGQFCGQSGDPNRQYLHGYRRRGGAHHPPVQRICRSQSAQEPKRLDQPRAHGELRQPGGGHHGRRNHESQQLAGPVFLLGTRRVDRPGLHRAAQQFCARCARRGRSLRPACVAAGFDPRGNQPGSARPGRPDQLFGQAGGHGEYPAHQAAHRRRPTARFVGPARSTAA